MRRTMTSNSLYTIVVWWVAIASPTTPTYAREKAPDWVRTTAAAPWQGAIRRAKSCSRTGCGSLAAGSTRSRPRRATSGRRPTAAIGSGRPSRRRSSTPTCP